MPTGSISDSSPFTDDPGRYGQERSPDSANDRGRRARQPLQIPWAGWLDVLWRAYRNIQSHRLSLAAASVAFWAFFAIFPALIAIVSLYGLVASPGDVVYQVDRYTVALPSGARELIEGQLRQIVEGPSTQLTLGIVSSVFFSLFTAAIGVVALIDGINVAYGERETRGWLQLRMRGVLFAASIALFVVFSIASITILLPILETAGLGEAARLWITWLRWPVLAAAVMAGLAILYRYGPNRTPPKWPWVVLGAAFATLLWTTSSIGFAIYADNFARFNRTYGTLGAVIVLLSWLYFSSFAILIGAELNAELERQTAEDSTIGTPRPMGQRHAFVADTLGEPRPHDPTAPKVPLHRHLVDLLRGLIGHSTRKRH